MARISEKLEIQKKIKGKKDQAFLVLSIIAIIISILSLIQGYFKNIYDIIVQIIIPITIISICLTVILIYFIQWDIYKKGYVFPYPKKPEVYKKIFGDIKLNEKLINNICPSEKRSPIFVRGKDHFDIKDIKNKTNSKYDNVRQMESFKSASMLDMVSLSKLAVIISSKAKNRIDNQLPFGMIDVDVLDVEYKKIVNNRTLISIGGGDTNALTAWIFREFERQYNTVAPLRFNSRQASESIIAETSNKLYIYPENFKVGENKGLIFIMENKKHLNLMNFIFNNIKNFLKPIEIHNLFIVAAGNHKQGTLGTATYFEKILDSKTDINAYEYDENIMIPNILLDCYINGDIFVNHISNNTDENRGKISIVERKVDVLIVLGHDYKDLQTMDLEGDEINWLTGHEACRIIDFIMQYKNKKIEIIYDFDFDLMPDLSSYKEIITVGTIYQNKYVQYLYNTDEIFKQKYDSLTDTLNSNDFNDNCGAVLIYNSDNTKIASLLGNLKCGTNSHTNVNEIKSRYRSTQSAILGLIQLVSNDKLIKDLIESDYICCPDKYYDTDSKCYIKKVDIITL